MAHDGRPTGHSNSPSPERGGGADRTAEVDPDLVSEAGMDVIAIARERQDVVADLLEEQLELALDALIACRLGEAQDDLEAKRLLLAELYDAGIASKAQVYERGKLELGQFFDYLRAYRLRAAAAGG